VACAASSPRSTPTFGANRAGTVTLVDAFERAAALLRDPAFQFDPVWHNASDKERRVIVEELIEAVTISADRLEVTVTGAPPLVSPSMRLAWTCGVGGAIRTLNPPPLGTGWYAADV
jgi:hypothetical protein